MPNNGFTLTSRPAQNAAYLCCALAAAHADGKLPLTLHHVPAALIAYDAEELANINRRCHASGDCSEADADSAAAILKPYGLHMEGGPGGLHLFPIGS